RPVQDPHGSRPALQFRRRHRSGQRPPRRAAAGALPGRGSGQRSRSLPERRAHQRAPRQQVSRDGLGRRPLPWRFPPRRRTRMSFHKVTSFLLTLFALGGVCLLAPPASAEEAKLARSLGLCSLPVIVPPAAKPPPEETLLFDFEEQADLKAWSNLELPDARQKEPAAKIERSTDHATRGRHSLKITFAGGRWPTITTTKVPGDWMPYWAFRADVTASRPCVVGFTVLQEKSQRGGGW